MPIYVYKNLASGETFEVQQPISEPAFTTHPQTGEPVKRLIQPVGIAFKGSGFYVTDSRKTSSTDSKSASSPAKDSSAAKDSSPAKDSSAAKDSSPAKDSSAAKSSSPAKDSSN